MMMMMLLLLLMMMIMMMMMMMMMIIIIIITSDTSKNKSEYNYHKLYKASSLNLKIISSKGLAFSSFFGAACLYDQVTFRGCLSAVVRSDSICFLIEWMDENWSLLYKSCPMTYKSCHRWSKINYYSWFLSRGTSRLIKWFYIKRDTNCSYWKQNNNLIDLVTVFDAILTSR